MKRDASFFGSGVLLGLIIGLTLGWKLYRPAPTPREVAASAVRQGDGSLVLERAPESAPGPAPHALPIGGVEERRVQVIVKYRDRPASGPSSAAGAAPSASHTEALPVLSDAACPPLRVDLSLVRMPDKSRRVVASSPDGEVVGGVDVPIEPPRPEPRPIRWIAGGIYDPANRTAGAFALRALGPFTVGAQVYQTRPSGVGAAVMVGVRW